MDTAAGPGCDTEALRRGIEGQDATALLSLYADDAELRVVDRNTQPSHPMVMRGREQIGMMLADSMMSLRDGKIVDQTVLQAWDAEE
ncbi:hypothetical protein ACIOKD_27830 [Streptomyces sp. NPDC087844]|uniref:hypothetical protein n=1 Tax=Streptomyces sp. NPDC087844 TaxID=3365805 RepID=UPI0037FDF7CE